MTEITAAEHRREASANFDILDPEVEAEFAEIVRAASAACGTPVSLVSLLDTDRPVFEDATGFDLWATPLTASICAHAATQRDVLVIPDTTKDKRTADSPLVTGVPHVRFYAGVPLETAEGVSVGALCVLDTKPNRLSASQALILRTLARQAMAVLELRHALRRRREADRRNAAILESAIDYGIIAMDLNGRVTSWNAGAEQILGWGEAEMLGRPAHVFFTAQDTKDGIPEKEMGAALLHGRGKDERWHLRKDGTTFWANGEMMPLKDEDGRPEGFIKILRDRTVQRNAAAKQQADAEFMRGVLASSADCIKVLDLDGRLTFMSEGGQRVMEVSDFNAIKGCPWPDFWAGQGHVDAVEALSAARGGGVGHFQGAADTMAGTPRWWDVQVTPILDTDGLPEKILSVSRDITDQKSFEGRLAASEERWRGLFTGMQEGFHSAELIRDADGRAVDYRFLEVNPAFAGLTGLPADSAGRTVRELVPDIPQWLIDTCARVVETGTPETFEIYVPELHRTFEVRARKQADERFAALFLEISERKRGEARRAAMTELGDRLRDVADKGEISRIAAEVMGRALGLSHAGYGQVDPEAETVLVAQEWTAPGLTSIAGLHQFRDYGSFIEDLKAGRDVVIDDTGTDPRTAGDAEALAAISARALLNLPVQEHGRFVALFYGVRAESGAWAPEDIAFVRNVADRTRSAVARVEAEEQQRVLNLELSHRLKNTLALVQSIASQTLRNAGSLDEAREALAARLIALGKAHDILLTGHKDGAPITAIIDGALSLHDDTGGRFRLNGPELPLGPSAALALGLILHELSTNAAKYGALTRPEGYVAFDWAVQGEGVRATLNLAWTEHGGPPVTPPVRRGFGSRLIGRGLAGGTVDIRYPVEGVTCAFACPLAALKAGS